MVLKPILLAGSEFGSNNSKPIEKLWALLSKVNKPFSAEYVILTIGGGKTTVVL